jgi:hypothetical protein
MIKGDARRAGPLSWAVRRREEDMDDAFRAKLESKLDAFHQWAQGRDLSSCRLVQYLGVEMLGAIDVPLGEVESRIEALVCEGFYVDWTQDGSRLRLRAWESDGPEPPWSKVLAEEHLAEIDAILREARERA